MPAARYWVAAAAWAALAAACALGFALLTLYLAGTPALPFDIAVERGLQAVTWYPVRLVLRGAADVPTPAIVTVVAGGAFLAARRSRRALAAYVLTACASVLALALKVVLTGHLAQDSVSRLDPSPAGAHAFPSGHATVYAWLGMALGGLAVENWPRRRFRVIVIAVGVVLLLSTGGVFAGDHWPREIFGGWLVAVGWACLVRSLLAVLRPRRDRPAGGVAGDSSFR